MTSSTSVLSRVPVWLEVTLILVLCFGIPTVRSIVDFSSPNGVTSVDFSDAVLVEIILAELLLGAVCVGFLYLRGFRVWLEIPIRPSLRQHIIFIGLCIGSYVAYALLFNLVYIAVGAENLTIPQVNRSVSIPFIVAVSLINPIFEEVFVVGYLFERLKGAGPWILVTLSVVIRVSYHLYQGWIGIVSVLPVAILFAITYWKTRNLWSLVLAHAVMDFTGLAPGSSS